MNISQWLIARKLISAAYESKAVTGLPASILAAQCILETGWLKSIPRDYITGETSNNLFGIKSFNDIIPYIECVTHEYYKGEYISIIAKFRKYKSHKDSFIDYGNLILRTDRYKKAVANKNNERAYILELWKAGYATDPQYPYKVLAIAEQCGYIPKAKV